MIAEEAATCPADERCGAMVGRVQAHGQRRPIAEARVVVVAATEPSDDASPPRWTRGATTDADGRFAIAEVPAGAARVIVLAEGHERLEQDVEVVASGTVSVELFLPVADDDLYRTVVTDRRSVQDGRPPSVVLSREEIATLPGTQGDALRALQNLPGVARPPGGLGLLVMRGAPPSQSLTMIGEHPAPRAFHAWPLAAVVQADAIESVELVLGNASARYGPLMGGVVLVEPRRPRRDAAHGHGKIDLTGIDAEVDGPMGRASYLVAARRGWIDAVLRGVEPIAEQGFLLPGLWDYQAWVVTPVRHAEVEVRVLGAGDRVRSRYWDPVEEEPRNAFEYQSRFHRFDLVARWRSERTKVLLTPTLRLSTDDARLPEDRSIVRKEVAPGWRAEIDGRIARTARVVVGTDGELAPYRGTVDQGVTEPDSIRSFEARVGLYAIVHFGAGNWRISPGVRVQSVSFGSTPINAIDPRLGTQWAVSDRVTIDLGVGHYSLPYATTQSESTGLLGASIGSLAPTVALPPALVNAFEPRVVSSESLAQRTLTAEQGSASVSVELPWDLDLRVGAFGRYVVDPGFMGARPVRVSADRATGVDAGGELLLRKRVGGRLYGWVSYTVMRSLRWSRGVRYPGDYDQPHNLLTVASLRLRRGWRFGTRFRLSSGNPYTPIVAVVDVDGGFAGRGTDVIYGEPNEARFPLFHQLDVRLDKQWFRPRATITCYFDLQNVYNRQNVEAWVYAFDRRGRVGSVGLPIFPSLGLRVDI